MENLGKFLIGVLSAAFEMPLFSEFKTRFSGTLKDLFEKIFLHRDRELYFANLKRFLKKQEPQWHKVSMVLDCSPTFVPNTFIGDGWRIGKLEIDCDPRVPVDAFDFSTLLFETLLGLEEIHVKGEVKLQRHRQIRNLIPLGANAFQALWLDYQVKKENSILEVFFREKGVICIEFYGDILKYTHVGEHALRFIRRDGAWLWGTCILNNDRSARDYSAVYVA